MFRVFSCSETPYQGETKVLHYLELLRDAVGFDEIRKKVNHSLNGHRIGAYYGCLLLRPSSILAFDDPEDPSIIEDFLEAVGATPVRYQMRNECCGGYRSLEEPQFTSRLVGKIFTDAKTSGCEELVTACPLCYYNLQKYDGPDKLPVRYISEVLAQALGIENGKGVH